MKTPEELLKNLDALRDRNRKTIINNELIDQLIIREKRKLLHKTVSDEITRLINFGKKTATQNQVTEKQVLIYSEHNPDQIEGSEENIQLTATPDSRVVTMIRKGIQLYRFDNSVIRICYLEEFKKRSKILLEKINNGHLDDLFGLHPKSIIHEINGCYGGLLFELKINSKEGYTHQYLRKLEKTNTNLRARNNK